MDRVRAAEAPSRDVEAFYTALERNHLVALWKVNKNLLPREPRSRCIPHLWRWATMLPLVRQGAAVDRPSELHLRVDAGGVVHVGGLVSAVGAGTLTV